MERRKVVGECLRCAWPSDWKGSHRVKDCIRPVKLDKGTASYPKAKDYQKMKVAGLKLLDESEDEDSQTDDSEEESEENSGSESEEESEEEELEPDSEGEYLDEDENQEEETQEEEGKWWDSPPPSNKVVEPH
jgi:hypothetical protein